jgi:hypothetical protein
MAAQKKTKKQQMKSKNAASNKMKPMKKSTKKAPAVKRGSSKKGSAKRMSTKKRAVVQTNSDSGRMIGGKIVGERTKPVRRKSETVNTAAFPRESRGARSGQQSGDLQGLSSAEGPDSESVEELIEEGNAFEADVVAGVESAGEADEREVSTHEVPEDDVPGEYLDKE